MYKPLVFRCTNCLNMSTRPRITFDKHGKCNACVWVEEKKKLDWSKRQIELKNLLSESSKNSKDNKNFDCIVPVSGGKDGSYVAYQLKNIYNINPLCVTVRPPLEMDLGKKNLNSFVNSGFAHIHITANYDAMREISRLGFIEKGFPYYGFLIAVHTAVFRIAYNFGINLIFYGEDGEVEYGGLAETKHKSTYNTIYQRKVYLEDGYDKVLDKTNFSDSELYFFTFPSESELKNIKITHWSYFEPWDPYRNYLVAKEHCGLQENLDPNAGTFTNFAQNDQYFYALHTYIMYLKFGFGRATQDAGIEIRRGAMTREQGLNLVRLYDAYFPDEYLDYYLDYYNMSKEEFDSIIDKWANKKLFTKINNLWTPIFETN